MTHNKSKTVIPVYCDHIKQKKIKYWGFRVYPSYCTGGRAESHVLEGRCSMFQHVAPTQELVQFF